MGGQLFVVGAVLAASSVFAFSPVGSQTMAEAAEAVPPMTFALIGDTPYSAVEEQRLPSLVGDVNSDSAVEAVLHAGDVKSAAVACNDDLYRSRAATFDKFADPFVLTPGDNDWTDCHTTAGGGYVPTERLDALREIFYPRPGVTLGQNPASVESQAGYPENVIFERAGVVFATAHVVGSANDRSAWSGLPAGDDLAERRAEFRARDTADIAWINRAFDRAAEVAAPGVVLMMQAEPKDTSAFRPVRTALLQRVASFPGQVLLVHGDGHVYTVTRSYAGLPNLTRLQTYGETAERWLRVTVDPNTPEIFTWQTRNVPPPATAPVVTGRTPAPGATGIGRFVNATATFSEAVVNVDTTTMTVRPASGGTPVAATVNYDVATRRAVLDPSVGLRPATTYIVQLSDGVTDVDGNPLAATSWTFTTRS